MELQGSFPYLNKETITGFLTDQFSILTLEIINLYKPGKKDHQYFHEKSGEFS